MDLCKFESFCGKSDVWMERMDGWMDSVSLKYFLW